MTAHPIDRARARFEDYIEEGMGYEPSRGEAMAVLDALAAAEHRIARLEAQTDIRGRAVVIYRERAREAEAQVEAWRKQYEYDTARLWDDLDDADDDLHEAEAERNEWKALALQERAAALDSLEQIKARDARIKAVRDVLDQAEATINHHPAYTFSGQRMNPIVNGADIRRALDN